MAARDPAITYTFKTLKGEERRGNKTRQNKHKEKHVLKSAPFLKEFSVVLRYLKNDQ